jgi:uncharacterized membrane protein YqjE
MKSLTLTLASFTALSGLITLCAANDDTFRLYAAFITLYLDLFTALAFIFYQKQKTSKCPVN